MGNNYNEFRFKSPQSFPVRLTNKHSLMLLVRVVNLIMQIAFFKALMGHIEIACPIQVM